MFKTLIFFLLAACSTLPKYHYQIRQFTKQPLHVQIEPFESDGCSLWPEGTEQDKDKWLKCCVVHDLYYWKGGTLKEKEGADLELKECVDNAQGKAMGAIMKNGVDLGGKPHFNTDFKWGYGWTYQRGYLPTTLKEQNYIQSIAPKKDENLSLYIKRNSIDTEVEEKLPIIPAPELFNK